MDKVKKPKTEDESDCYFAIEQPAIDPNLSVVENLRNLLDNTKYVRYNRDKDTGFFSDNWIMVDLTQEQITKIVLSGADRNIMVYDKNANENEFTVKLIELINNVLLMNSNLSQNKEMKIYSEFTHLIVSPKTLKEIQLLQCNDYNKQILSRVKILSSLHYDNYKKLYYKSGFCLAPYDNNLLIGLNLSEYKEYPCIKILDLNNIEKERVILASY